MIIDGKKIASEIIAELKQQPRPKRFLAVFLIGNNPASESFVRQKEKTAKELGVDFRIYKFPEEITNDKLRKEIEKVVLGKKCGGAIVQLPLPSHLNWHYVLNAIPREKDLDVLCERALGAFYNGRNPVLPPAVGTVQKILEIMNYELEMKRVGIVGLGTLVGKPISVWLERKAQDLILLRRGSDFLALKECDLVITGVGKAGLIKPEMLKSGAGPVRSHASVFHGNPEDCGAATSNGAGVIDFGYGENDGGLAGDLDASSSLSSLSFYTPTPGGTGPILVAQLFKNFYKLTEEK